MTFENKLAIVTGGGRDIGRAVSLALASGGAKVAINYCHSQDAAEDTLRTIKAAGGDGITVKGDMTKEADVARLVDTARGAFGNEVHILVNMTGGLIARRKLLEMDEAFLDEVMHLNLNSSFLTAKHVVPHMPSGGAIVNCASQAARDGGGPGAAAYASAKGAVLTFTRSLAKELGAQGIRVNCVSPGMIDTTFHDTFTAREVRTKVAGGTALGREGQSREVAELVTWLASDAASYVTGGSYEINGGSYFI